jgi:uncharacterized protein YndB with AHSA1/START domain
MLAAVMTRIESEIVVATTAEDVWLALLDHARWASWSASSDTRGDASVDVAGGAGATDAGHATPPHQRITLESVEPAGVPTDEPADQVGALRCVTATVAVPLLGRRRVRWVEQVTDVAAPWTIEFERLERRPFKRWRLRLWLLEQDGGETRVRCRLSYTPASLSAKLANPLFIQRALHRQVEASLRGLAQSFQQAPSTEHSLAAGPAAEEQEHKSGVGQPIAA